MAMAADGPPNLVQARLLFTLWDAQGHTHTHKMRFIAMLGRLAISPNSASCEHVFALLKRLFGEQQMSSPTTSLADLVVQAALMLNYHNRSVG